MRQKESLGFDFVHKFGETEVQIERYQKKYVGYFRGCSFVLDIGCDRGVFLELLRKNGIRARGIEINPEAVELCRRKGLGVMRGNVLDFLKKSGLSRQKPEKNISEYDGMFCAHLIEHLTPEEAMHFLKLANSTLCGKGVLVIITPNPRDLRVLTEYFWLDPSHIRPYPLELLTYLVTQAGFTIVAKGEDRDSYRLRGHKTRMIDFLRNIFTLGLGGRGDLFMVCEKRKGNI